MMTIYFDIFNLYLVDYDHSQISWQEEDHAMAR